MFQSDTALILTAFGISIAKAQKPKTQQPGTQPITAEQISTQRTSSQAPAD
jgi:hypothetical protein